MKQIEVQIMQQSYLLGCPEGHESRLLQAVERVDTAMTRIRDAGKVRARERIAVLAALNLAFEIADREEADLASAAQTQAAAPTEPAPLAPAAGPQSTDAPAPLHASHASLAGDPSGQMQLLLRRLDDALGDDGRLL
ncbi:cell division protein ZapA [Acidovorax sp. SUPP2522]|uniref:cell division protein ZapA n=1 Tax=unclassified Acidovorax TaxID=2684926 RepID=UPI00234A86DB|nr:MULTISPECIES: cell division protein ZapA [unclassified Acidovorax]WCM95981.1 cell division protein ZapA [Acidovorax sp. GBBC 1281]GKT18004.1 cell division protein ZapA [Acidovorax sp. SUPP2522]